MGRSLHNIGLAKTALDWIVHNCVLEEYGYCPLRENIE